VKAKKPSVELTKKIQLFAQQVTDKIISAMSYNVYTNDLRKDIEQDLWVEYYTTKNNMPDLSEKEILDNVRLNFKDLPSIPKPMEELVRAEGYDLPDDFAQVGGQIYRKSARDS
jgi:hypothetical protein